MSAMNSAPLNKIVHVTVPQIPEQTARGVKVIPQALSPERIVEQIVIIYVPQVVEEIVEETVVQIIPRRVDHGCDSGGTKPNTNNPDDVFNPDPFDQRTLDGGHGLVQRVYA